MSKVEQFERIRRDHAAGVGLRELARVHGVHRRTVRQAIASAVPPPRKAPVRAAPRTDPFREVIRGWLVADLQVRPKQRHTARRVWQRLIAEHGADVGESTVRAIVVGLRAEIALEHQAAAEEVMIVQGHRPGERAEVDFGEFDVVLAGALITVQLFIMRLSASGKGFARAYLHQAQEVFFDGHVRAFAHFDGVPAVIAYDNLRAAVHKVLFGRDRVEQDRFVALRSAYLFDSFYCRPGIEGAHEKGGVEGEIGRFRRRHLVPVPQVTSMAELNVLLEAAMAADDDRVITGRRSTVGQAFSIEQPHLRTLPAEPFDVAKQLVCRVDAKARISVRQAHYSVPAHLAGRTVHVRLDATHLEVCKPGSAAILAVHERSPRKYTQTLELDHYLEILARKPGALRGAVCLEQARATGKFTDLHQQFWDRARRHHGDRDGTNRLVEVLLLHRRYAATHVWAGLRSALKAQSTDPALVAMETRRYADGFGDAPATSTRRLARVIPLPDRIPADTLSLIHI